jgi:hypothetical protein
MKTKTENSKRLDILGNGDHSSDREIFNATLKQWRRRLGYCSIFAAVPAMLVSQVPRARADEAKKPEGSVAGRGARLVERLNMSGSNPALLRRQSKFLLPHQKGSLGMLSTLAGNDDCPGGAIPGGNYTAAAPYIESGDTTGANDTITRIQNPSSYYYYYSYDAHGPDRVYSFTLTGRGPNPQIQVSTTSGTYRPLVYVLQGGSAGTCPAGTGNLANNEMVISDSRWTTGSTATLDMNQMNYLPLNVPLYLFVDSANNDASGSGSYTIRMQDVTIAPGANSNPNPIDSADTFVRQHYLDFLNREPDAGGLAYWTDRITQCGSDARCIHERRIGVSGAFFVEMEFQETGYYVDRFYKASFGRQPNYAEFSSDRGKVIGGSNLEANKQAFADEWVQRPAFVAAYPITMSNTEVVNKLFDSAGLTSSIYDALRQQEIAAMNAGRSRALVLRDVIEIPDFKNIPDPNDPRYSEIKQTSQYNPAFVLMQYFGYFRRNVDQNGYDFWLDVVNNRQPNNYRGMVCSFITSTEYQLRFGSQITRSNADCGQ